jgi:type IV secretion system protein VirB9
MIRFYPKSVFAFAALALGASLIQVPGAWPQTQVSPGTNQYPAAGPAGYPAAGPAGPEAKLTYKEQKGVRYGRDWAGNRDMPARGEAGGTVFVFGSTLPTIVCAPLFVCDLALEPGEGVNDLNVGDSVRWKITPASEGSGEGLITHVIIKPTDTGLITNLVLTTNRRTYTIKLVSREKDWMPKVSFDYPDETAALWRAYRDRAGRTSEKLEAARATAPGFIDGRYRIEGDKPPWRPVRVYTDGVKTIIQFPAGVSFGDLPALVELADDGSFLHLDSLFYGATKTLVNYRFLKDRFEADKVLNRALLISGVGDSQLAVTITRMGE